MGNLIAQNIPIHSGLGKEMAQFKIDHLQNLPFTKFVLELTITGLSFQPIDPQKVKVVFE